MLKYLYKKLLKYLDYFIVFVAVVIFLSPEIKNFCTIYSKIDFDSQALLVWAYNAVEGKNPYKDVFYPYGILSYLKDHNFALHILNFLIFPTLITICYFVLKKLYDSRKIAILLSIFFFLFIVLATGIDAFNRYGILIMLSSLMAYVTYSNKLLAKKFIFFLGILGGVIFTLITDQGIYLFLLSLLFIAIFQIFSRGFRLRKEIFINFLFYFFGLVLGLLPFLAFLALNNSIGYFLDAIFKLADVGLYAKTPFFHSLKSSNNIFIFAILLPTIYVLGYKIANKTKKNLNFYLQLFLAISFVIILQKSIIRSIDNQLTFVAFLLVFTLMKDIGDFLGNVRIKYNKLIYLFFGLLLVLLISFFYNRQLASRKPLYGKACINENINHLINKNENYKFLIEKLQGKSDFRGKIFSFPSDPILYIVFDQSTPYYSNNYDSSAEYAQKKQIEYIEKHKIEYIIYNQNVGSLQDSVPNYIRTPKEMRYVFSKFEIIDEIGNFILLRKSPSTVDLFNNDILKNNLELNNYFSRINLNNILLSEGLYKSKFLYVNKNKSIFSSRSLENLNNYLKTNNISSLNKILKLTPNRYELSDSLLKLKVYTHEGDSSEILFNKCKLYDACIINLINIPLFYKERVIKRVEVSDFEGEIELISNYEDIFW